MAKTKGGAKGSDDAATMLQLAEARFDVERRGICAERERRLDSLRSENLTSAGRAARAFGIYKELLVKEVDARIAIYRGVSDEYGSGEMLSQTRLDDFRQKVAASIGFGCAALKDRIERDSSAAGEGSPLPHAIRYQQLRSSVTDVLDDHLKALALEGAARRMVKTALQASVIPFQTPEGLKWDEVEIRMLSEHSAQVFIQRTSQQSRTYVEMGFADWRSRDKPEANKAWCMLREIAEHNGRYEVRTLKELVRRPGKGKPSLDDPSEAEEEKFATRQSQEDALAKARRACEKRMEEIRKNLRGLFPTIGGDPLPFVSEKRAGWYGYRARFAISLLDPR